MVVGCRGVVISKQLEKDFGLTRLDQNLDKFLSVKTGRGNWFGEVG